MGPPSACWARLRSSCARNRALWGGCGLTGYGVQRGPGVGETLAGMALQQPLPVDVDSYRLDRFDPNMSFTIDMRGDNPFAGFAAAAA